MSAEAAFSFFQSRGWSPFASAGLAGNLAVESRFNPAAVGDGGRAYGLAQWHPDRQANFARVMGRPIRGSSFDQQLAFVDWELRNTEKRAGTLLRGATSADQAAVIAARYYERPADTSSYGKRKSVASSLLDKGKGMLGQALGQLGVGDYAKSILGSSPAGMIGVKIGEATGLMDGCGYLCQFQNWIKESGFFQRMALAILAFIILLGALYLMKGAPSLTMPRAKR